MSDEARRLFASPEVLLPRESRSRGARELPSGCVQSYRSVTAVTNLREREKGECTLARVGFVN